jgi:hypothetical protein
MDQLASLTAWTKSLTRQSGFDSKLQIRGGSLAPPAAGRPVPNRNCGVFRVPPVMPLTVIFPVKSKLIGVIAQLLELAGLA